MCIHTYILSPYKIYIPFSSLFWKHLKSSHNSVNLDVSNGWNGLRYCGVRWWYLTQMPRHFFQKRIKVSGIHPGNFLFFVFHGYRNMFLFSVVTHFYVSKRFLYIIMYNYIWSLLLHLCMCKWYVKWKDGWRDKGIGYFKWYFTI